MSVIDDTRKVLQDFLAPALRAIAVRLDALEKRFDAFETTVGKQFAGVDQKFADSERRADRRHDELLSAIRQLGELNSVKERLARLESRDSLHQ